MLRRSLTAHPSPRSERSIFGRTSYKKLMAPWYRKPKFYLNLIRRTLAEFLGTGLFVFVAVSVSGSVWLDWQNGIQIQTASATLVALASGMAYAAMMAATLHVSGGHLNPAVTVAVFISGGINIVAVPLYFAAQIAGAIAGSACVLAYDTRGTQNDSLDTDDSNLSAVDYGLTLLRKGYSPGQGILVEMLLTLFFVMVFLNTTLERGFVMERKPIDGEGGGINNTSSQQYPVVSVTGANTVAPIIIGFALTACIMSSYSITTGSFNPARSFGPAVLGSSSSKWESHYIYWVGPLVGSLLAGLFYRLFLSSKPLIPLAEDEIKNSHTNRSGYSTL